MVAIQTLAPSVNGQEPVHPLRGRAKILLSSVFGPYATDDDYGSRRLNPMELYQNQVTRSQGPFSLRMFHRSWGLMFIQANVDAPCTLLDFPTLERFVAELRAEQYDIIGISSIVSNELKVRKMCELIRRYQPRAKIVVGGHIASIGNLQERVDADYVVRGEGARWFRQFLGEDVDRPYRHPVILSAFGTRVMGIEVKDRPGEVAATLIPSVGCPLGCNFCATSALFGGKGNFINFFNEGDELFDLMSQLEQRLGVCSFFVMDENFLLHRRRAMRLLELMERHNKPWALYVFSSANALLRYSMDELVRLGVSWVWMGLEGEEANYTKLRGSDPQELVRTLQSHGIRVLGSSIIGLENHGPDNIDRAIDYAVAYATDFHQFMLYTPLPGTQLFAELSANGLLKQDDEYHPGEIHGQSLFRHRHPRIPSGMEAELILRAFERDFAVNGPSIVRMIRTTLNGYDRYADCDDRRVRARYRWEGRGLATTFAATAAAARRYFHDQPALRDKMQVLLDDLIARFGVRARLAAAIGGRYLHAKIKKEERRLAAGYAIEPETFLERNYGPNKISPVSLTSASQSLSLQLTE